MKTKDEKRRILSAVVTAALAVLLFWLLGELVAATALLVLYGTTGSMIRGQSLFLENYQLISLIRYAVTGSVLLLPALFSGKARGQLGIRKPRPAAVPAIFFAGFALSFAVSAVLTLIPMPEETVSVYNETMDILVSGQPVLMGLNLVVLAPLVEELAFRALAFRSLRRVMPFWPAAIITSLAFGLVHTVVPQMIYAALLGLLLTAIDEKADSALPGFICHAGFNALSFVLTLIPADIPDWAIIAFGAAAAAAAAVLFILLLGGKRPLLSRKTTSEVTDDASL